MPRGVVNPQVFDRPGFQEKWARIKELTSWADRLTGQTAWISGAASGIGAATARLFAEEGANVALVDINADRGEMTAEHGGPSIFIQADVSVEEQVRDSLAKTVARFGGLNIIVNCAGLVHVKLLHEYDEADWDRLMGVNLKSIFFSVKHGAAIPAAQPAELRRERRVDQQLRRPGRDAGLHGLEVSRARAEPIDRARLCRARAPLQLRLPGDHRHADVARASGQDAGPRGDPGRASPPRSDAVAAVSPRTSRRRCST